MTGTLRYMAPEVGVGKRYNEACDVYSFAILLWEIFALERPYKKLYSQEEFMGKVFVGGLRPPLRKNWTQTCKDLLVGGWCSDPAARLTIVVLKDRLRKELRDHRCKATEEAADNDGQRQLRRSTFVYHAKKGK